MDYKHPATLAGQDDKRMMPPLKKGAALPQPDWPGIKTERLVLRQWRASDVAANMKMLGDPLSARTASP